MISEIVIRGLVGQEGFGCLMVLIVKESVHWLHCFQHLVLFESDVHACIFHLFFLNEVLLSDICPCFSIFLQLR